MKTKQKTTGSPSNVKSMTSFDDCSDRNWSRVFFYYYYFVHCDCTFFHIPRERVPVIPKERREKEPAPPAPKLPVVVIEQATLVVPVTPHIEYYAMLDKQDSKDYLGASTDLIGFRGIV